MQSWLVELGEAQILMNRTEAGLLNVHGGGRILKEDKYKRGQPQGAEGTSFRSESQGIQEKADWSICHRIAM